MKPIDLVIGKIEALYDEKEAGWKAYFEADSEIQRLRAIIKRLKNSNNRLLRNKK
jgi:hypothetical protein